MAKPSSLSGFRDFLPAQAMARAKLLEEVRGVFRSFGFAPIETPAIERIETLAGKYGEEGDRLIFRLLKVAGNLIGPYWSC